MTKIRYDVFICLLIVGLLCVAANSLANRYIDKKEADTTEEKEIPASEIAGKADDTIPIVSSVADMEKQSRFTVQLEDSGEFIYAEGQSWRILKLESGETVLADVYSPSIQFVDRENNMWESDALFPVGRLVEKQLSQEILDAVEDKGETLSVTDCYIDMADGNNKTFDADTFKNNFNIIVTIVAVAVFILLHTLGVKIGIFPSFIPRRK